LIFPIACTGPPCHPLSRQGAELKHSEINLPAVLTLTQRITIMAMKKKKKKAKAEKKS